jgi:uncharacterized protein YhfF
MDWHKLETFSFGDNPGMADELAGLVLAGLKCATCWAVSEGALTCAGKRMVLLDGAGQPLSRGTRAKATARSTTGAARTGRTSGAAANSRRR